MLRYYTSNFNIRLVKVYNKNLSDFRWRKFYSVLFMLRNFCYKISFKDSSSPIFEKLLLFYDIRLKVLVFVLILMLFSLYNVLFLNILSRNLEDWWFIEILWTVVPALVLVFLAVPSVSLLFFMDDPLSFKKERKCVKVIGHQWYWSYEYRILDKNLSYDSLIAPVKDLNLGDFRILEVEKPLVLNCFESVKLKGISRDVIHSWTCPTLGVKIDVVPGRLNRVVVLVAQYGVFFGQCSEICGVKHRFMPIQIEVV
jgi:cytochrome c oxidase subunit 2